MVLGIQLICDLCDMIIYMKGRRRKKMKNKDFDSFNNDRILAARKRVIDLLYLIGSWEEQKQQKQKQKQ